MEKLTGIWASTRQNVDFDQKEVMDTAGQVIISPDKFDIWAEKFLDDKILIITDIGQPKLLPYSAEWFHNGFITGVGPTWESKKYTIPHNFASNKVKLNCERRVNGKSNFWEETCEFSFMAHPKIYEKKNWKTA